MEKVLDIKSILIKFLNRKTCTMKQLESLIGKLCYIADCIRAIRLFISRQQFVCSGKGRDSKMLSLPRNVWFICSRSNIQLEACHISSEENREADLLSR